jgi:hypothetical protein
VPTGRDRVACASNPTLVTSAAIVATLGMSFVNPSVYLRPTAQQTSRRPATTR